MSIFSTGNYDLIVGVICLVAISYVVSIIYSVYLGPLSKFPGPKLAAATLLYEFYYDFVLKGRYTWKIRELHQQYGLSSPHLGKEIQTHMLPQDQSSASVPMSSTSTIQTTTTSSTPSPNPAKNTPGWLRPSGFPAQHSQLSTTSTTACGTQPWRLSSPKPGSTVSNPCFHTWLKSCANVLRSSENQASRCQSVLSTCV